MESLFSGYNQVKYDLVRISCDLERDQWGEPETVLFSQDMGLSIIEPRISPDGRWIAFSSKKDNYAFTRTYLAYVDESGRAYKAFILPQKDPMFYDSCLKTYTVPEFITEPVKVTRGKLWRVVRDSRKIMVDMPITMATPGVPVYKDPWGERE